MLLVSTVEMSSVNLNKEMGIIGTHANLKACLLYISFRGEFGDVSK